jgi:aminocarboxymuconate-semialdehyde decarboxylase
MAPDASTSANLTPAWQPTNAIDVHAHCVPPSLLVEVRRNGKPHGVDVIGPSNEPKFSLYGRTTPTAPAALIDIAPRLAAMQRKGVARELLSPWMELTPFDLEPADALWFTRAYNDALAELAAASAGKFDALGMVPLGDAQAAEVELRRAVDTLGLAGVEIATSLDGVDLSAAHYEPFWRAAAQRRAFVLLHPLQPLGAARYPTHRLRDIVGNPAESTAAVGRLILSGLLRRIPDLTLCVVHGGGFLPYQAGRFEAIAALDEHPWPAGWVGQDLRKLYFDSLTHSERSLQWLIEFASADHVMVGSDYPFTTGCGAPLDPIAQIGLAPAQREAVLLGTAQRLLDAVRR